MSRKDILIQVRAIAELQRLAFEKLTKLGDVIEQDLNRVPPRHPLPGSPRDLQNRRIRLTP